MDMKKILKIGTICVNKFLNIDVRYSMRLSLKNIAITLGIAAGAAIAAVVTTKSTKNNTLFTKKKNDVEKDLVVDTRSNEESTNEEEVLYI